MIARRAFLAALPIVAAGSMPTIAAGASLAASTLAPRDGMLTVNLAGEILQVDTTDLPAMDFVPDERPGARNWEGSITSRPRLGVRYLCLDASNEMLVTELVEYEAGSMPVMGQRRFGWRKLGEWTMGQVTVLGAVVTKPRAS